MPLPITRTLALLLVVFSFVVFSSQAALAWTFSGTIYGGSNPLPDTVVTVYNAADQTEVGTSITDSNGAYSVTVEDGTYNLSFVPAQGSGYSTTVVNGIVISAGNVSQNITLLISSQLRNITGYLKTGSGLSLYPGEVNATGHSGSVLVEPDGSYSIDVPEGVVTLSAAGNSQGNVPYYYTMSTSLTVASNVIKDMTLPIVKLNGKTTDINGVGIGDVKLQFVGSGGNSEGIVYNSNNIVYSDASGNYTASLLSG